MIAALKCDTPLDRFVSEQNLARYRKLLDLKTDESERRMILRLLEKEFAELHEGFSPLPACPESPATQPSLLFPSWLRVQGLRFVEGVGQFGFGACFALGALMQ